MIFLTNSHLPLKILYLKREVCGKVPTSWKNNNCESINHSQKAAIKWIPQCLDLIKALEKEVKFQGNLIKLAIQGIGEFKLSPKFQYLKIKETVWE